MNNEKIMRKPRQSTDYWRQAFAEKAIESETTTDIPNGSKLILPNRVIAEMGITTAHIVRKGRKGHPEKNRSSFGEIIEKDGSGKLVNLGIGLVVSPDGSNFVNPQIERIEEAASQLSREDKAILIGILASRIASEE
jgi:hypothetical protein